VLARKKAITKKPHKRLTTALQEGDLRKGTKTSRRGRREGNPEKIKTPSKNAAEPQPARRSLKGLRGETKARPAP